MFSIAKQWILALAAGAFSVILENLTGSVIVSDFLKEDGLLALVSLLAVNTAVFGVLITTMVTLEHSYKRYYAFDASKKEALSGIKEMILLLIIFYALAALVPDKYWELNGVHLSRHDSIAALAVGATARMCIFQTVYAMYDFIRALVKLTTDPKDNQAH